MDRDVQNDRLERVEKERERFLEYPTQDYHEGDYEKGSLNR